MVPKEEEVGEEREVTINCFEYETKSLEHLLRFLDQVKCLLHENGVPQDFNRLSLSLSRAEENLEQRIADKVKESLEEQFLPSEGKTHSGSCEGSATAFCYVTEKLNCHLHGFLYLVKYSSSCGLFIMTVLAHFR